MIEISYLPQMKIVRDALEFSIRSGFDEDVTTVERTIRKFDEAIADKEKALEDERARKEADLNKYKEDYTSARSENMKQLAAGNWEPFPYRGVKGLHSKKKLFTGVGDGSVPEFENVKEKGLNHPKVGNETYGKKSMIYLYTKSRAYTDALVAYLKTLGFKVRRCGMDTRIEVHVSYFRGDRYWE